MGTKVLLHICCAPCAIYPLRILREQGYEVRGFFYNPNIHPYQEYRRRWEALAAYAADEDLSIIAAGEYPLESFLRQVAFREAERCRCCYDLRLDQAAAVARREGFDAFTTTLLYSRFQRHELIARSGQDAASRQGVDFLYRDFRDGWSEGVRVSKARGIYRQSYCGCIFSERDRFYPEGPRMGPPLPADSRSA